MVAVRERPYVLDRLLDAIETKEPDAPAARGYEALLHALGVELDRAGAQDITVFETSDAFEVKYRSARDRDLVCTKYTKRDLLASSRSDEPQLLLRGRYADLLAAIGWEIDHYDAAMMLVEEVDGAISLSYHVRNHAAGPHWFKRWSYLNECAQQTMLRSAEVRRRPAPEPLSRHYLRLLG